MNESEKQKDQCESAKGSDDSSKIKTGKNSTAGTVQTNKTESDEKQKPGLLSEQSSSGGHSQAVVIKHRDKTQDQPAEEDGAELQPETQQGELPPSDESKACTTSGKDKEKKSACEEKASDLDEDAPTGFRVSDVA